MSIVFFVMLFAFSPNNKGLELRGRELFGPAHATYVQDSFIYASFGMSLVIMCPYNGVLRIYGSYDTEDYAEGIVVKDSILYLANYRDGLLVLDVTNKHSPFLLSHLAISGYLRSLALHDSVLFVSAGNGGVYAIDVKDPSNPQVISKYATSDLVAYDIYLQDSLLYVADEYNGLLILDIQNPDSMVAVGQDIDTLYAFGVYVYDTIAYLASHLDGLVTLNVKNPTAPYVLSKTSSGGFAFDVYVKDTLAFVSNNNSLAVFNVKNPGDPVLYSNEYYDISGNFSRIYGTDSIVYVSAEKGGFIEYNVHNPFYRIFSYNGGDLARGICATDSILYVADGDNGIYILDTRDMQSPYILAHLDTDGYATAVEVKDSFLYVADDFNGFLIIDVKTPENPVELGGMSFYPDPVRGLCAMDTLVYLAVDRRGIVIVNVSVPDNPVSLSEYNPGGSAISVTVKDSLLYVANYDSGVTILDVKDPANPLLISRYRTGGYAFGLYIEDTILYVADEYNGVVVLNVKDPANPVLLASYSTGGHAYGVTVKDTFLFVADFEEGVKVLDIKDPQNISPVYSYDTHGESYSVAVSDSTIYVADGEDGVYIFFMSELAGVSEGNAYKNPYTATVYSKKNGLNLRIPDFLDASGYVNVYNGYGARVYSIKVCNMKKEFKIQLEPGVYFMEFKGKKKEVIKRIMVLP